MIIEIGEVSFYLPNVIKKVIILQVQALVS
jgi:hypothetical protein